MKWWLSQPSRAERERSEIGELQERSAWLDGLVFRLSNGLQLAADFSLKVGEEVIEFTITYPDFFPDVPPSIVPKEPERVSGHQWGAGGELCLEYRADNWSSEISGVMMIESAYRLLSGEVDSNAPPLPSAHNMSLGQEVRLSKSRLLLTAGAKAQLLAMTTEDVVDLKFVDRWFDDSWFAQPTEFLRDGEVLWSEAPFYKEEITPTREGKAWRLRPDQSLPQSLTAEKLLELVAGGPLRVSGA